VSFIGQWEDRWPVIATASPDKSRHFVAMLHMVAGKLLAIAGWQPVLLR
jgi:hypothetical protein